RHFVSPRSSEGFLFLAGPTCGCHRQQGLPLALTLAYLTFFSEFVAAACLAVGLFTRIVAAMIFIQMMVIVIVFQGPYGFFWTNRGYEYPLLWAAFCLAIFFRGGGRWSVDHYIGKEF